MYVLSILGKELLGAHSTDGQALSRVVCSEVSRYLSGAATTGTLYVCYLILDNFSSLQVVYSTTLILNLLAPTLIEKQACLLDSCAPLRVVASHTSVRSTLLGVRVSTLLSWACVILASLFLRALC